MSGKRANGDGSIFKATRRDGSTCYKVEITIGYTPDGRAKRTRRTVGTFRDAKDLLKRMNADHLNGKVAQIRADTVLTYGMDWIRNVKAQQVKPTTANDYEDRLRRTIAPTLGQKRLIDLTPRHVEAWMATLRRDGCSARTVNGSRQVLFALCKHAVRSGVIPHNPVANTDPVKRLPGEASQVRCPWTVEEARRVLNKAYEDDALDVAMHLLLHTGMRIGEVLGLRWCDVDLSARVLSVTGTLKQDRRLLPDGTGVVRLLRNTPKTEDSARTLPIGESLLAALDRQRMRQQVGRMTATRWEESGYVVTTSRGTPVNVSNLRLAYQKFLARIGVRYIRLHDIRHTVAVISLNDAGTPLEKVSQALGHDRIDTTKRIYARHVPRYNQDFAQAMDKVLPAAPQPAEQRAPVTVTIDPMDRP